MERVGEVCPARRRALQLSLARVCGDRARVAAVLSPLFSLYVLSPLPWGVLPSHKFLTLYLTSVVSDSSVSIEGLEANIHL